MYAPNTITERGWRGRSAVRSPVVLRIARSRGKETGVLQPFLPPSFSMPLAELPAEKCQPEHLRPTISVVCCRYYEESLGLELATFSGEQVVATGYEDPVLWIWICCSFLYSKTPTAQKTRMLNSLFKQIKRIFKRKIKLLNSYTR